MPGIDREWITSHLKRKGMNQSDLARALGLDRSAISHLLSGKRSLKAHEQDKIAQILGLRVEEFAARRSVDQPGFSEPGQAAFNVEAVVRGGKRVGLAKHVDDDELPDHPIWGSMEGTITVMPGVDLTAPMEFEWGGKLYNE